MIFPLHCDVKSSTYGWALGGWVPFNDTQLKGHVTGVVGYLLLIIEIQLRS
jgi:hypothetical protein